MLEVLDTPLANEQLLIVLLLLPSSVFDDDEHLGVRIPRKHRFIETSFMNTILWYVKQNRVSIFQRVRVEEISEYEISHVRSQLAQQYGIQCINLQ